MKAPEKIWLSEDWFRQFEDKAFMDEDSIEYTRTDAFIEKAQLFFIDKLKEIPIGFGYKKLKAECSLKEFIDEFINYMKG